MFPNNRVQNPELRRGSGAWLPGSVAIRGTSGAMTALQTDRVALVHRFDQLQAQLVQKQQARAQIEHQLQLTQQLTLAAQHQAGTLGPQTFEAIKTLKTTSAGETRGYNELSKFSGTRGE